MFFFFFFLKSTFCCHRYYNRTLIGFKLSLISCLISCCFFLLLMYRHIVWFSSGISATPNSVSTVLIITVLLWKYMLINRTLLISIQGINLKTRITKKVPWILQRYFMFIFSRKSMIWTRWVSVVLTQKHTVKVRWDLTPLPHVLQWSLWREPQPEGNPWGHQLLCSCWTVQEEVSTKGKTTNNDPDDCSHLHSVFISQAIYSVIVVNVNNEVKIQH